MEKNIEFFKKVTSPYGEDCIIANTEICNNVVRDYNVISKNKNAPIAYLEDHETILITIGIGDIIEVIETSGPFILKKFYEVVEIGQEYIIASQCEKEVEQ